MSPVATPSALSLSLASADVVLLAFYFLVGAYAIFTAILYYHWQSYASDVRVEFITLVVYFAITIPLLITLAAVALTV